MQHLIEDIDFLAPTDPDEGCSPLYNLVVLVYTVFWVYLLVTVRKAVRERDNIREERCVGCEDLVCAVFCGCCTVSQLARQTADYELDEGHFFTPTGLPAPPPIVMDV